MDRLTSSVEIIGVLAVCFVVWSVITQRGSISTIDAWIFLILFFIGSNLAKIGGQKWKEQNDLIHFERSIDESREIIRRLSVPRAVMYQEPLPQEGVVTEPGDDHRAEGEPYRGKYNMLRSIA